MLNSRGPMTREEILQSQRDYLTAEALSGVLGTNPSTLRNQAHEDAERGTQHLKFPYIILGKRVLFPRIPFIRFMGWTEEITQKGAITP